MALAIVCAGGIVRGFTGFGSGLVMVPLLTLLWGPVEALTTTVGIGIFATFQLVPRAMRLANWRDIGPIMGATVACTPLGTALLVSLDPLVVKKIIAALVLAMTLVTLSGWSYRGPRGIGPGMVAGALGGLINGVAGVGGPPTVLYILSLKESAQVHRANIVMVLAITTVMVLGALWTAGAITHRVLVHVAVFAVPSILSVWLGAWLFTKLPGHLFRLIVLWFLIAISLAILLA